DPPPDEAREEGPGEHQREDRQPPPPARLRGRQRGRPVQPAAAPGADAVRLELGAADVLGVRDLRLRLGRGLAPGLVILGHGSSLAPGSTTSRTRPPFQGRSKHGVKTVRRRPTRNLPVTLAAWCRSEEHTSELQSRENLVCRLLLEKKKA